VERNLRRLIGSVAIAAPTLHLISDALEWIGRGFSPLQLWVTYVAFLLVPFMMIGLYAVQRPRISWTALLGAFIYGVSFVYFAYTALYALVDHIADYHTLWSRLDGLYTFHGGVMIVGGVLFGIATLRAGVLAPWAGGLFVAGLSLNLLFAVIPVPEILQTFGSTLRNLGLIGMGVLILRRSESPQGRGV
jgi:hypothetical protein